MLRTRGKIKTWHKAFIWALLANVAKGLVEGAKLAGKAALKTGEAAVGTGWNAGKAILSPAEKAFEAFKSKGAEAGLKEVGNQLYKSTDLPKSIDLVKGVGDFISSAQASGQGATVGGLTPKGREMMKRDAALYAQNPVNYPPDAYSQPSPIDLGGININKPVEPKPTTFNQAFLDSIVGKQPDLTGAGRMAYFGDTLADLVRTGAKLSPTEAVYPEDNLNTLYKQERLNKIKAQSGDFPPELQAEVDDAIKAITTAKADATKLYQLLASKYPKYSSVLKRIFLPKSASITQNIFGEADSFMSGE